MMMPSGIPTTTPTSAVVGDCHATTAANWRRVKPRVSSIARVFAVAGRTDEARVSPSADLYRADGQSDRQDDRRGTDASVVHDLDGL